MNVFGHTLRFFALLANVFVGVCFLFCAYSQFLSPVEYPVFSCAGLFFPVFLCLDCLFLLFWTVVRLKYAWLPVVFLLAGWGSVQAYIPFRGKNEPIGNGKVLKFLTYNVMGMPSDKADTVNLIVDYIRKSDADVVCLQEYPASNKAIENQLSFYPYIEIVSSPGWSRMACLSKFPILSAEEIQYESESNGSFMLRLKMDEDTMVVVCNHLESNKLDSHDKEMYEDMLKFPDEHKMKSGGKHLLGKLAEAAAIRAPQADSVALALKRNYSPYLLVCGDFNDSPLSYAHRVIGQGLQDAYIEAGWGPGFSYNRNFLYFRIDHIFVGDGFRVLDADVDNSIAVSDHYPLWCTVEKL